MSADRFGPIVSRWTIVEDWLKEIRAWLPEYLSAYERQAGIEPGRTRRPRTYVVRHAAMSKAGEETPAIIGWPAGVTDRVVDPDTGAVTGTLQAGITVVAGAKSTDTTGDVLHRIHAALYALLLDRTTLGGHATGLAVVDEDFEGIDAERDRLLQQAQMSIEAYGVLLGVERSGPGRDAEPRPDTRPPWPPLPTAETVRIDVRAPIDPED